jgi:hypothetical protein
MKIKIKILTIPLTIELTIISVVTPGPADSDS